MTFKNRVLVIGSGSIAKRHIKNIKTLFPSSKIICMSSSGRALTEKLLGVDQIITTLSQDVIQSLLFAIIASPAPYHIEHAIPLLKNNIHICIEKPISNSLATILEHEELLFAKNKLITVGYNLHFLPSAIFLKESIDNHIFGKIYSAKIEVGQYLPFWRPGTDYKNNVSANQSLGGGALLELSHEIDYLTWLFGDFESVYCIAQNSGNLDIDVEDNVFALFKKANGMQVSLSLDFLQRKTSRYCKILAEKGTIIWDLIQNSVTLIEKDQETSILYQNSEYDFNQMYTDEMIHMSIFSTGECEPIVNLQSAINVIKIIEAMRESSLKNIVINIGHII